MARKITSLSSATALAGTEVTVVHQATVDKQATMNQISDHTRGNIVRADIPFTAENKLLGRTTAGAGGGEELSFGDIDHDSLNNTHNLTTDIDHDQLTNFASDEHRKITLSTSDPTGGADGDIWFKYTP